MLTVTFGFLCGSAVAVCCAMLWLWWTTPSGHRRQEFMTLALCAGGAATGCAWLWFLLTR